MGRSQDEPHDVRYDQADEGEDAADRDRCRRRERRS